MSSASTPLDTADEAMLRELDALTIRADLGGKTLDEIIAAGMAEELAALDRSFDRRTAGADNDNIPEDAI